ncbi:MAG: 3-isopropylmalate dehydratase small subunit [Acidobacteriota bacterium]
MAAPRFHRLRGRIVPVLIDDIDTDQIIPARYLKTTGREGLAEGLFAGWRSSAADSQRPFPLDDPRFQGGSILLAGENFGCGSSREHAPWALLDHGFRAVIAPSFADIFRSNAQKNGLLPVSLPEEVHRPLADAVLRNPRIEVTVDLERLAVELPGGTTVEFEADPFTRICLLRGVDPLGYLLDQGDLLADFERRRPAPFDTRSAAGAPP